MRKPSYSILVSFIFFLSQRQLNPQIGRYQKCGVVLVLASMMCCAFLLLYNVLYNLHQVRLSEIDTGHRYTETDKHSDTLMFPLTTRSFLHNNISLSQSNNYCRSANALPTLVYLCVFILCLSFRPCSSVLCLFCLSDNTKSIHLICYSPAREFTKYYLIKMARIRILNVGAFC